MKVKELRPIMSYLNEKMYVNENTHKFNVKHSNLCNNVITLYVNASWNNEIICIWFSLFFFTYFVKSELKCELCGNGLLKKLSTLNFFPKCVKFGTKLTLFKINYVLIKPEHLFSKWINIGDINFQSMSKCSVIKLVLFLQDLKWKCLS